MALNCSITFAQEDQEASAHGIKLDFKLPSGTSNRSFKSIFNGLADVDFSYQYWFENIGLITNVGVKYGYWGLESTLFSGTTISGRMEYYAPFVGIGYRMNPSEKIFIELELKGGVAYMQTKSSNCATPYKQEATSIEPKVGIYMRSTELLSIGLTLNYNFMNATFSPDNICLQSFPGLDAASSQGTYQYFSIGFGFYAHIPSR